MSGLIGSVFFTSPAFREKFSVPWIGWLSVDAGEDVIHTAKNAPLRLHDSARQYEFGTQNLQAILSFQTALDYLKSIGFENIRSRILDLTDHFILGLKKIGIRIISPTDNPEERSPIISFSLWDKNTDCVKKFAEESIVVSSRAGNIRVAINIFNNFEDIDKLLAAISSIMQ